MHPPAKNLRVANISLASSGKPYGIQVASCEYVNLLLHGNHDVLFVYRDDCDLQNVNLKNEKLQCFKAPTRNWLGLWRTRAAIKKFKPDVIISHNHFSRCLLLGKWIAPIVGIAHSDRFPSVRRCDGVIVLHPNKLKPAADAGIKKAAVIYNTSRCENARIAPPPSTLPPVPTIGVIGGLVSQKNFLVFVEALEILQQRGIQYRAVIAGTGEQRQLLQDKVEKSGVPCEFLGYVNDVADFYNSIDIFCMPSVWEPFGLVLLDAMAMQKMIVASDLPSFRTLLNNGENGRFFERTSAPQLADAIADIIQNPSAAAKRAAAAREYFATHYSYDVVGKKLNEFLISMIKNP